MLRFIIFIIMLSSNVSAQTPDEVKEFVKSTTDNILITKSMSEHDREKELISIFTQVVDAKWMARFAIGSHWGSLDEEQQKIYIESYKNYLLRTYLPKFEEHSESNYKIDGIDDRGDNLFIANMTVFENGGQTIKLSYKIKCLDKDCYIRDLIAEEVSMVLSQRSDFASIINSKGFDGLISSLNNKSTIK
jgi:phospholipid transport system substrate-binding protein